MHRRLAHIAGQAAQVSQERRRDRQRREFFIVRQRDRRDDVRDAEGCLEVDAVPGKRVGFGGGEPARVASEYARVLLRDPRIDRAAVADVHAVAVHGVHHRRGRPPVGRVHHRVGEVRLDLVQFPVHGSRGRGGDRPRVGQVGSQVPQRGDGGRGVLPVKHRDLARVHVQQEIVQETPGQPGRSVDPQVVRHQPEQRVEFRGVLLRVAAQLAFRRARPAAEPRQGLLERVTRHGRHPTARGLRRCPLVETVEKSQDLACALTARSGWRCPGLRPPSAFVVAHEQQFAAVIVTAHGGMFAGTVCGAARRLTSGRPGRNQHERGTWIATTLGGTRSSPGRGPASARRWPSG